MSLRLTHLFAYLLLPLLLGPGSFYLLERLLAQHTTHPYLLILLLAIALLLASLPITLYQFLVQSRIQDGFAQLADGRLQLPWELTLGQLLRDEVKAWLPRQQRIDTSVCLDGERERYFVSLSLPYRFAPTLKGKRLLLRIDEAEEVLERAVQNALYLSSKIDKDLLNALSGRQLLNEEDEKVIKSKVLSTLESLSFNGISFPFNTRGIHIDRTVRRVAKPPFDSEREQAEEEENLLEEFRIDPQLLHSLGFD